jgi:YidC/Oxa1 family membrane protein insertase
MFKSFINFINELRLFFFSLDILKDLKNIKPNFVFFSENKSYQKYSKQLIDTLCSKYNGQIYYFSIDKNDKIENKKVNNYYINPLLMSYFFNNVKSFNMFLTLTDLGNNFIKKTENIDNYIYYFHSPVSTTKNYTPKAFDNYDMIMCNGQFQIEEIKSRENLKNLPKKKFIPSGYFYFDYLIENVNQNISSNEVLIAPSWNKDLKNFINENFIELIEILIKKEFKVIFRPHPEHFKRSKNILNKIKNKFLNQSFELDENDDNINSMERAKCLITDSSGIAIEYMIALKRPVLYLNEHDKVHNTEFEDYLNLETIDKKIKDNFGYSFEKKDFNQIDNIIYNSQEELTKKLPKLNQLINDNFFNFGRTKNFLNSNLDKFFQM